MRILGLKIQRSMGPRFDAQNQVEKEASSQRGSSEVVVPGVGAAAARFFVKGRNTRADRLVIGRGRQRALGS